MDQKPKHGDLINFNDIDVGVTSYNLLPQSLGYSTRAAIHVVHHCSIKCLDLTQLLKVTFLLI